MNENAILAIRFLYDSANYIILCIASGEDLQLIGPFKELIKMCNTFVIIGTLLICSETVVTVAVAYIARWIHF